VVIQKEREKTLRLKTKVSKYTLKSIDHIPFQKAKMIESPTKSEILFKEEEIPVTRKQILCQFILMSICFGLNHGALAAALDLAPALLGEHLGTTSASTVYAGFMVSAYFAPMYVPYVGHTNKVLALGMTCYTIYNLLSMLATCTFLNTIDGNSCSDLNDTVDTGFGCPAQAAVMMIGSIGAGIGAGMLFVAEGVYFSNMSLTLSEISKDNDGGVKSRSTLSSVFCVFYVSIEVCMKLLGSAVKDHTVIFAIYSAVALFSTVMIYIFLKTPPYEVNQQKIIDHDTEKLSLWERATSVPRFLYKNPKATLLLPPFNCLFGYASGYQGAVIVGLLISKGSLGKENAGYASAIVPVAAVLFAVPYSFLSGIEVPKLIPPFSVFVIIMGPVSYIIASVIILVKGYESIELSEWGYIVGLEILVGSGRAIFESAALVTTAEWFSDNDKIDDAMSVRTLFNAFGGFISFLLLGKATVNNATYGLLILSCAVIALAIFSGIIHFLQLKQNKEGA